MVKGKYGYYPCDWTTYQKLKKLNMAYSKALSSKSRWDAWDRKEPQNRVIRAKIRNSNGQVVGYQAGVPLPEPEICPVFCRKVVKSVKWGKKGGFYPNGKDETFVEMVDLPIYKDYRLARYPAPTEEVCGLSLKLVEIDDLFCKL